MNIRFKKTWVAALGVGLTLATVGIARAAEDPAGWYDGDNATVADGNRVSETLKLYDASGVQVTTGSTTTQIAAFAAADTEVRAGDTFGSLFVHLPQTDTTPGAWPGVQVSGTDQFSGAGAVTAPGALSGKPFVRANQGGYTFADVTTALPNTSTNASFDDVYELRLRTSSAAKGVSDQYAATWIKITGSTWTVTTAPVLGGTPDPVATSVVPTWPASITFGTAASVPVEVNAASGATEPTGTVSLVSGAATVIGSATLAPNGTATIAVPKTALAPGAQTLKVTYSGASGTFAASESAPRSYTVAKATPGKPAIKITTKPTSKKTGKATVTVATPSGLPKATGKAVITIKKGGTTKKVTVTLAAGKATATLPKLPKGTWTVTVAYAGNAAYKPTTSASSKLTIKA